MRVMVSPRVLVIPDPCLVVLIGAAGSGKSTFAGRNFATSEVLSSDAYRQRVSGDAADQAATGRAFAGLHTTLSKRLSARQLAVVDATSVQTHARRQLLRRAAAAGVPSVAIVLDLPPALVLARNAARADRVVPEDVVRRQLADLDRVLRNGQLDREGYLSIVRLTSPADVDAVRIARAT
jgi:protein phosphatase